MGCGLEYFPDKTTGQATSPLQEVIAHPLNRQKKFVCLKYRKYGQNVVCINPRNEMNIAASNVNLVPSYIVQKQGDVHNNSKGLSVMQEVFV